MKKKFILYLARWQLSTPILALFTGGLNKESFQNSIVANLCGGCLFFWVDRWIFNKNKK